jgi:hypothetical protein
MDEGEKNCYFKYKTKLTGDEPCGTLRILCGLQRICLEKITKNMFGW